MAFPVVEATNTSAEAGTETSHTVALPASIAAGELLIAVFAVVGSTTITWPSGWTEFFSLFGADKLAVAWRKADGGEGASITVTTGDSLRSAHGSYRISGASDPTEQPPEASTGATGNDAAPDPDALSPTGGASDYLWIAVGAVRETITGAPTNYTNLLASGSGGTGAGHVAQASARRELAATSEDPGAFTASASSFWEAGTIAVYFDDGSINAGGTLTTAGQSLGVIAMATKVGTLTTAGAISAIRVLTSLLAGTLTTAGALTVGRLLNVAVGGTLTTIGRFVRIIRPLIPGGRMRGSVQDRDGTPRGHIT